nr:hypothetical protein [Tanacetum cinerariifolium]
MHQLLRSQTVSVGCDCRNLSYKIKVSLQALIPLVENSDQDLLSFFIISSIAVQTSDSGISNLLAVGTTFTGSENLYCQWELSPGSRNALCILFPTPNAIVVRCTLNKIKTGIYYENIMISRQKANIIFVGEGTGHQIDTVLVAKCNAKKETGAQDIKTVLFWSPNVRLRFTVNPRRGIRKHNEELCSGAN